MEEHEPAVGQIEIVLDDRRLQGIGVRREPFGRLRRVDLHLRTQPRRLQSIDRPLKSGRNGVPVRAVRTISAI
ncbi:hypothetical protein GCM10009612_68960 [Streptomyces beijiangensis]